MKRQYHKWYSEHLGRTMELLVFGNDGPPAIAFPTSQGRFYDFEDYGMVDAVRGKLEDGQLQLFCVDSVDSESWYNRNVPPRWRIARHLQYQTYIMEEVVSLVGQMNGRPQLSSVGCSFGGYHAANIAFRYPDTFTGFLTMGGVFDLQALGFMNGYHDDDLYRNLPMQYLPATHDPWYLERYRRNNYVLATGANDQSLNENESLARILRDKEIPVRLDVWGDNAGHDWPWWRMMAEAYL